MDDEKRDLIRACARMYAKTRGKDDDELADMYTDMAIGYVQYLRARRMNIVLPHDLKEAVAIIAVAPDANTKDGDEYEYSSTPEMTVPRSPDKGANGEEEEGSEPPAKAQKTEPSVPECILAILNTRFGPDGLGVDAICSRMCSEFFDTDMDDVRTALRALELEQRVRAFPNGRYKPWSE
jgi:hypothetical protein